MTGAKCRIRPDWLSSEGFIVDVKSTTDASESAFANSIVRYRYHVQDAFYSDGVEKALGKKPKGFVFIAVEKTAPYAVGVYIMPENGQELGREAYLQDLASYQKCLETGNWHGYGNGEAVSLQLPKWAFTKPELDLEN